MTRLASTTVVFLLLAAVGSAQSPAMTVADTLGVRPGERVLVTMDDGRDVVGRIRTIDRESVVLESRGGVERLSRTSILRIVRKDSVRNGLLIGLGAGAAAGLTGGLLLNMICINETGSCPGLVLFLTGIGAGAGSALGAGVDGLRQQAVFDRIPGVPGEFVPEIAANIGFGRSRTWNSVTNGPPSAGASWSIRHSTSGWGLELRADRTIGSSTRTFACHDQIEGCADAKEGVEDLTTGTAKAQYFFAAGRVEPYVGAGVVIYQASVWRADLRQRFFVGRDPQTGSGAPFVANTLSRQQGMGFVAGGGARIAVTSHLSVRPDLTFSRADDWQQIRGSVSLGVGW